MALLGSKTARIEELEAQYNDAQTRCELAEEKEQKLSAELSTLENKVEELEATLKASLKESEAKIGEIQGQLETAQAELAEERESFEGRCNARAREILVAEGTGVSPIEEPDAEDSAISETILERYHKIKDPAAKSNFYREHEAEFRAAFAR